MSALGTTTGYLGGARNVRHSGQRLSADEVGITAEQWERMNVILQMGWIGRGIQKHVGWTDLRATEKAKKDTVKVRKMTVVKKTNATEDHKLEDTEFEEILFSLLGLSSVTVRRFLEDPPSFETTPY